MPEERRINRSKNNCLRQHYHAASTSLNRGIIVRGGSLYKREMLYARSCTFTRLFARFLSRARGGEDRFRDYAEFIRREWDAGTAVTISRVRALTINKDAGTGRVLYKLDGLYIKGAGARCNYRALKTFRGCS